MNKWIIGSLATAALFLAACSDDDSNNNDDSNNIVNTSNWIGSPCTCEGSGCEILKVPLPSPSEGGVIKGCENIDATGITGGKLVCIRTIGLDLAAVAPTVYAPQGYCSISAVKAVMDENVQAIANMANYGDTDTFTTCPAGSALLESTFDYSLLDNPAAITNKTCVKLCAQDSDCNVDGEMTCLNKDGHKFCYNEENLKLADTYTVTEF